LWFFVTQVRVRLPEKFVREIDRWVVEKGFKSRSDAIRAIIALHEEWEETRKFLRMLASRSDEARKHPEMLIPFEKS
jgi:Arc/MetJ-type ribon-helix-helix transcriptional regulator